MRRMLLVLTVATSVTVALVFAFAAQAGAAGVTVFTGHYTDSETFLDPGPTAVCGFNVTFSFTINGTFSVRVDSNGNPIGATDHEVGTVSESANGITLTGHTADNFITFFPQQQQFEVGLNGAFTLPGAGKIAVDGGRIVATFDGTIVAVDGPHAVLNGDDAALCAALTP
jgi:hypothetical protein